MLSEITGRLKKEGRNWARKLQFTCLSLIVSAKLWSGVLVSPILIVWVAVVSQNQRLSSRLSYLVGVIKR